ncbi:MAG: ABC transporter permease [Oscillospiraceae bacterium]|jgi:putative ABC transport system permease protein|nr:ABC transporter permease [Oscillospiraceae bacterium]
MKLTARLAYSQIKINRSRTVWTLLGIVLSTALITAVCSFAASGGALLAELFGAERSGGTAAALLLVPAGVLSAIIVSVSVVVISNAFRVSAGSRIAQFGVLKSVGATKRQITATVIYESIFLSAAGIPVGIVTGLGIAFAGVGVANHFLVEINSLVDMMINELIIVVDFVIAWQALIAAALISFFTVLLSAWLPARRAARFAAIDGVRGAGEVKIESKRMRSGALTQKLFGFEGALAAKSMKRNKRNFRASVISLAVGVVLFINLGALSGAADAAYDMLYPDIDATVIVDYTSLRRASVNETTGKEESIIAAPVDGGTASAVTAKLRGYENTDIFGTGGDNRTYNAVVPREMLSPQMLETYFYSEERPEYEMSAEIIVTDEENYAALCSRAGVPPGSNILINHYGYYDNGRETVLEPFLFAGRTARLIKADGSVREVPVHGELTRKDIPNELLPPNRKTLRLLVPQRQWDMDGYLWYADPADVDGFINYARAVMAEAFPRGSEGPYSESSYMELGFDTRVYEIRDYMKVMNIGVALVAAFMYGFVALLTLIGLTNVISTMSANVRMRSREFAVLQSVGMTRGGLKRMLSLESVLCSAKALSIGLPLGAAVTLLVYGSIGRSVDLPYVFPWPALLECVAGVFAVTWAATRFAAGSVSKQNIAAAIRAEGGI